jgi:type I restriction enzyme S subunit
MDSGSAIPSTSREDFYDLDILLPPLPEQQAIASILSSLDDKIDLLHRQNKTLEALAETLFRQWFVEEAEEGWDTAKLGNFGAIICGKTPSKKVHSHFDGNIPFVKIPDMHGKTFVFDTADSLTEEGAKSQNNKHLPPKSILVSCIATVGLVTMNAFESQTNQQINSIIPKHDRYRYYLYLKLMTMKDELLAMASGGTATDNLNTGDFSDIEILMPDEEILKKFHHQVSAHFDNIFANQAQIRTLTRLRDTLLPKLMSGEIRVVV